MVSKALAKSMNTPIVIRPSSVYFVIWFIKFIIESFVLYPCLNPYWWLYIYSIVFHLLISFDFLDFSCFVLCKCMKLMMDWQFYCSLLLLLLSLLLLLILWIVKWVIPEHCHKQGEWQNLDRRLSWHSRLFFFLWNIYIHEVWMTCHLSSSSYSAKY